MSTLQVTWIFMSTRQEWHKYSPVHITGDMNIHQYMWRVTEYSWAHLTGDCIFMSTRNGWLVNIHVTRDVLVRVTEYSCYPCDVHSWIFTRDGWLHIHEYSHVTGEYSWVHVTGDTGEYSWVHVTGDMDIHECTSWVTWIFTSTSTGDWIFMLSVWRALMNIQPWRMTEYSRSHVTGEYSWVHVTGDTDIHECTSRVTWISMSARHGWHGYPWVHVTGDMDIHECTSWVTWIFTSTSTGDWIFMLSVWRALMNIQPWRMTEYSRSHVTGEYSWVHVTGDMDIHECTSRVTWISMSARQGWHEYSRHR